MQSDKVSALPLRVKVQELVESRYASNQRPESWDQRKEGVDLVKTEDGKVLKLWSDGQQSPPQKGWILMIRDGDNQKGYSWTLYGLN